MENKNQSSDEKIKEVIRKLDWKAFWIGVIGLIVLLAFPIWITNHFWFDYSKTGTFGDTIGGLTAPIIGFFSALLIYLSFRAQIKANYIVQGQIEKQEKNENEKKEIEFINNLMSQFKEELSGFSFNTHEGSFENIRTVNLVGTNALMAYLNDIYSSFEYYNNNSDVFYSERTNQQYLGLFDILDKLIQIIKESNLNLTDKKYFKTQIKYLFDYKLALLPNHDKQTCSICNKIHVKLPCYLNERMNFTDTKIDLL